MNVLIVDDSADVRFMLRILLEDADMDVEEVGSGEEALTRLLDEDLPRPDAIVLDQRMPGLTGMEVARELAQCGVEVPTVLFSAYLHPDMHAEAERLGAQPVNKTDLGRLVETLRGFELVAA
jgi:CheY-like chemotaxis protein